jgi:hypothetical protein
VSAKQVVEQLKVASSNLKHSFFLLSFFERVHPATSGNDFDMNISKDASEIITKSILWAAVGVVTCYISCE